MVERRTTPEPDVGGLETYLRRVESFSKILYSPKVPVIHCTWEAVPPFGHDWKVVDWDIKYQHKRTNYLCCSLNG